MALAAVAGLVLSGCTVSPGNAAVVGGVSISENSVRNATTAVLGQNQLSTSDPLTTAQVNRTQVTAAIRHQLITEAAAQQGISVTDADVNSNLASSGGAAKIAQSLQVPESGARQALADSLLLLALIKKLPTAGLRIPNVQVTFDLITGLDYATAVQYRAQWMADPHAMDGRITAADTHTEDAVEGIQDAPAGIFAAAAGDVLIVPNNSQGAAAVTYALARVTAKSTVPGSLTLSEISSDVQKQVSLFDIGSLLVSPVAARVGVTVNPRYGIWDPTTVQVVENGVGT